MARTPLSRFALCLAVLPFAHSGAFADYVSATAIMDHGDLVTATAKVETYDGIGPPGGGLSAGQARVTVTGTLMGAGQPYPGIPGTILAYSGVSITFLTDFNLQPSQLHLPPNWTVGVSSIGPYYNYPAAYQVQMYNGVDTMTTPTSVSLLITGLGANITQDQFLLGQHYEDWGMQINFDFPIPEPTPEPSALMLGVLGMAGIVGRRVLRRAAP
jgi:hypothetical protein